MPQAFTPQPYQQPRELSEQEFTAIRDRLIDQAPDGLSEVEFNRWLNPRMEQALGEAENTAPKPEGSALGRFASGVGEMLNPIEMVKGVYSAVTSPIDTVKALGSAQVDQFRRGIAAAKEGRLPGAIEAVGRAAAGAVPLIGPLAASMGERAGAGDFAGAAGGATGLMAPLGLRPALQAARRVAPARAAATLEKGAASRVVDVMAPKIGPNKTRFGRMAEDVAPVIAKDSDLAAWSREGLHEKVGARLSDAETALDAAADARLSARTFPTKPIIDGLLEKRRALTSEAVVGSRPIPSLEPPGPRIVKAAADAASTLAKGEREFVLRWLADDLKELPYQRGGSTPASRRAASEAAGAGDELGKRGFVINPRVAGTPTQEMLAALGLKGSRAEQASRIEQLLSGKAKNPKLEALGDALMEAWDGQRFDFDLVSEASLAKAGIRRRDLRSPMSLPKLENAPEGIAARFFPEMVEAEPLKDVFPPQATKVGRPIGRDVVPSPNAARVTVIDQAIGELRQLGAAARYEPIRRIRQAYDGPAKAVYSPSMTQDFLKAQGGKFGAADVTGVLRDALAEFDPPTARANAGYALWRKANDVLEATAEVERTRPKVGRVIAARVAATVFGGHAAGVAGAAAGLLGGPMIEALLSSAPTTKLQTARLMSQLATAIRKGDVGRVNSLSFQIKRLAPTAAVATGRATSGAAMPTPQVSQ